MKRVLIFSLAYVPYVGGAELSVKEITDRFDPNEYAFDMITLRFDTALPETERIGAVMVHRIGFSARNVKVSDRSLPFVCRLAKALFPLTSFFKARSLHREHRYDAIWALMANQAGFGALFFKLFNRGIPYVLDLQDGNSLQKVLRRRPVVALLWPLYRLLYLKADRIKVISHFIKDLARKVGYAGRIEVIPNGVDIVKFSAPVSEQHTAELRTQLGKSMGDVFLFTASRLVLSRGVEDIIHALARLPSNVTLLIAGDGEDRGKLERIAHRIGVADRVTFLGHVSHKELPRYLRISDVFVRPSVVEGMGSAFIEAFAAGIPVVATPVGGIPDFLFDPDRDPDMEPTGLFCNVRDPESIARAVRKYMDNPALVTRITENARALAREKYDWSLIAAMLEQRVFRPLLEHRG